MMIQRKISPKRQNQKSLDPKNQRASKPEIAWRSAPGQEPCLLSHLRKVDRRPLMPGGRFGVPYLGSCTSPPSNLREKCVIKQGSQPSRNHGVRQAQVPWGPLTAEAGGPGVRRLQPQPEPYWTPIPCFAHIPTVPLSQQRGLLYCTPVPEDRRQTGEPGPGKQGGTSHSDPLTSPSTSATARAAFDALLEIKIR